MQTNHVSNNFKFGDNSREYEKWVVLAFIKQKMNFLCCPQLSHAIEKAFQTNDNSNHSYLSFLYKYIIIAIM